MSAIPLALVKAGITLAVIALTPFVAKAAEGLADKESWQWWNKPNNGINPA